MGGAGFRGRVASMALILIPWRTVIRPINAVGATVVNLLMILAVLSPTCADRLAGTA